MWEMRTTGAERTRYRTQFLGELAGTRPGFVVISGRLVARGKQCAAGVRSQDPVGHGLDKRTGW